MAGVAAELLFPSEWRIERSAGAIEPEWRAFQAQAVATPFQSYEWMSSLLEATGAAPHAVFALGYRDGKLCALFPLSLSGGTLSWLNDKWCNYNQPLIAPALFGALDVAGVDRLWREVRAALGNPCATILRRQLDRIGGRSNPFAQWARVDEPTKTYALNLGTEWRSFYEQRHSSVTRKGLERKLRRLERSGRTEWLRITEPQAIRDHIELMLLWKSRQLAAMRRRNPFAHASSRTMFADFAAKYPEKMRTYAVHVDGRPVAINFLLEDIRRLVLYQMAYDSGPVAKFSPGTLLLNHILEEVIGEKHTQLDFSIGDDPYKRELCDDIGTLANSIKAHSLAGLPAALKEKAWIRLKSVVKARRGLPAS